MTKLTFIGKGLQANGVIVLSPSEAFSYNRAHTRGYRYMQGICSFLHMLYSHGNPILKRIFTHKREL